VSPERWREPERIGGAVRRQLGRFGSAGSLGDVVERWPAVVGEGVAANAWPARMARDGTLVVHARDAVWAFELGHKAPEILPRLGEPVTGLRFVPGPLPDAAAPPPEQARRPVPEPGPDDVRRAAELVAGIADPELRERVAQAAAASLAKAADGRSVW
jgi:hypothetical protein